MLYVVLLGIYIFGYYDLFKRFVVLFFIIFIMFKDKKKEVKILKYLFNLWISYENIE